MNGVRNLDYTKSMRTFCLFYSQDNEIVSLSNMADIFLLRNSRGAKVCGLFFLIVLLGCWLAGQAISDHVTWSGWEMRQLIHKNRKASSQSRKASRLIHGSAPKFSGLRSWMHVTALLDAQAKRLEFSLLLCKHRLDSSTRLSFRSISTRFASYEQGINVVMY